MARREYTADEKDIAIRMHARGHSYVEISACIAASVRTIKYWVSRYNKDNSVANRARTGRPRLLTARDQRALRRAIETNPRTPAHRHATELRLSVTPQTVRNYAKGMGYRSFKPLRKPLLSPQNIKKRLEWCMGRQGLTATDYHGWTFSDECAFELLCSEYPTRLWTTAAGRFLPKNLSFVTQGGGGKVMLWGAISIHGQGPLLLLDGIIDGKAYLSIVRCTIIPFLTGLFEAHDQRFRFVQDNAPIHCTNAVTEALFAGGVLTTDWPARSPDLNPIENVWAYMKTKLTKLSPKPRNISELWTKLVGIWQDISSEMCRNLINSMPKRVGAVIEAKGGNSRLY